MRQKVEGSSQSVSDGKSESCVKMDDKLCDIHKMQPLNEDLEIDDSISSNVSKEETVYYSYSDNDELNDVKSSSSSTNYSTCSEDNAEDNDKNTNIISLQDIDNDVSETSDSVASKKMEFESIRLSGLSISISTPNISKERMYSFDSLLDMVIKNNKHRFVSYTNTVSIETNTSTNKNRSDNFTTDTSIINKCHKKLYQISKSISNKALSISSLSTCSISTFKLINNNYSKIRTGLDKMSLSETTLEKIDERNRLLFYREELIRKNVILENWKIRDKSGKVETVCYKSSSDESLTCANDEFHNTTDEDIIDKSNVSCQIKQTYNLKIPKPHIKQLETFLNLVNETQKNLSNLDSNKFPDQFVINRNSTTVSESDFENTSFQTCDDDIAGCLEEESSFFHGLNIITPSYLLFNNCDFDNTCLEALHQINDSNSQESTKTHIDAARDLCMHISLDASVGSTVDYTYDQRESEDQDCVFQYNFSDVKFHDKDDHTIFKFRPMQDILAGSFMKPDFFDLSDSRFDKSWLHSGKGYYNQDIICATLNINNSGENQTKGDSTTNDPRSTLTTAANIQTELMDVISMNTSNVADGLKCSVGDNDFETETQVIDSETTDMSSLSENDEPIYNALESTTDESNVSYLSDDSEVSKYPRPLKKEQRKTRPKMYQHRTFKKPSSPQSNINVLNRPVKKLYGNDALKTFKNIIRPVHTSSLNPYVMKSINDVSFSNTLDYNYVLKSDRFYSKSIGPMHELVETMDFINDSFNTNTDNISDTTVSNTFTEGSSNVEYLSQPEGNISKELQMDSINCSSVRGILKRKSSSSTSENDMEWGVTQHPDERKCVKFSMPRGQSAIIHERMNKRLDINTMNRSPPQFRSKVFYGNRPNLKLSYEHIDKVAAGQTMEPMHYQKYLLNPHMSKQVQYQTLSHYGLTKNSQLQHFMHQQYIDSRLKISASSQYINFLPKYNSTKYVYLKPTKVFSSVQDFNDFKRKGSNYECIRGYEEKFEMYNALNIYKPICIKRRECVWLRIESNRSFKNANVLNKVIAGLSKTRVNNAIDMKIARQPNRTQLSQTKRLPKRSVTVNKLKPVSNDNNDDDDDDSSNVNFLDYITTIKEVVGDITGNSLSLKTSQSSSLMTQNSANLNKSENDSLTIYVPCASNGSAEDVVQPVKCLKTKNKVQSNISDVKKNKKKSEYKGLRHVRGGKDERKRVGSEKQKTLVTPSQDLTNDNALNEKVMNNNKENSFVKIVEQPIPEPLPSDDDLSSIENYNDEYKQYLEENEKRRVNWCHKNSKKPNSRDDEGSRKVSTVKLVKQRELLRQSNTDPDKCSFIKNNEKNDLTHSTNTSNTARSETKRPQSCIETTRRPLVFNNTTGQIERLYDPQFDGDKNRSNYSKSFESINNQTDSLLSDTILNTKYKPKVTADECNDELLKDCNTIKQKVAKMSSDIMKIGDTKRQVPVYFNCNDMKLNKLGSENAGECVDNDSRETEILMSNGCEDDTSTEPGKKLEQLSLNGSTVLKKELETITSLKTKINDTFPDSATIKKVLLTRVTKLYNQHVKPRYPYDDDDDDDDKFDCFGAPVTDDLGLKFYNEYGKPLVNIRGCKIYDKCGIPKLGAYGKPLHCIRNKMKSLLSQVELKPLLRDRNERFEEDLLQVLNTFPCLKTDLYGRIYDFYGRPLFDRFGYIQYDLNGNPITDAFNRDLRDVYGRPLVKIASKSTRTSTYNKNKKPVTTNSVQNENVKKAGRSKIVKQRLNTVPPASMKLKSILASADAKLLDKSKNEEVLTDMKQKPIKKQVSFDECTVVYLENNNCNTKE